MRPITDERGLIGKVLVIWLVVFALIVVVAIDGASILISRVRTADLARNAASAGAATYAETEERREALGAALAVIEDADQDARLEDFDVSRRGEVTVVVTDRAGTLLLGRLGFLDDLTEARVSATSGD
jgi:hypothetical protein